jgi:hypothetical protein
MPQFSRVPRTRLERILAGSALIVTASLVAFAIPTWLDYRQSQQLAREPEPIAATGPPLRKRDRGATQTASMVKTHGLVWGGHTFEARIGLAKWLAAHGSSIERFARTHPQAARGLEPQR